MSIFSVCAWRTSEIKLLAHSSWLLACYQIAAMNYELLHLLPEVFYDVRQGHDARQPFVVNNGKLLHSPEDHQRTGLHQGHIAAHGDRRRSHDVPRFHFREPVNPVFYILKIRQVALVFENIGITREDGLEYVRLGDHADDLFAIHNDKPVHVGLREDTSALLQTLVRSDGAGCLGHDLGYFHDASPFFCRVLNRMMVNNPTNMNTIIFVNIDVLVINIAPPTAGMSAVLTTGFSQGCSLINCAPTGPC